MKVHEDTPDRLVLEDRPLLLSGVPAALTLGLAAGAVLVLHVDILAALILALVSPFMGLVLALFLRRAIVILDRRSGIMLWREATLWGQSERTTPLEAVRGVVVQRHRSRGEAGEDGGTFRVALRIDGQGEVPLTWVYSAGRGAERAAAALTRWLMQP
ncbi:MAG: hypothetical protein ACK4L4_07950 [Gemmobacter sp.]